MRRPGNRARAARAWGAKSILAVTVCAASPAPQIMRAKQGSLAHPDCRPFHALRARARGFLGAATGSRRRPGTQPLQRPPWVSWTARPPVKLRAAMGAQREFRGGTRQFGLQAARRRQCEITCRQGPLGILGDATPDRIWRGGGRGDSSRPTSEPWFLGTLEQAIGRQLRQENQFRAFAGRPKVFLSRRERCRNPS